MTHNLHWIDTHAHLNMETYDDDRLAVIERAKTAEVQTYIIPGYDLPSSQQAIQLVASRNDSFAAVGIHPHHIKEIPDPENPKNETYQHLRSLATPENKVVAIGEIGLDFYKAFSERDLQIAGFTIQLEIAREVGLPVIIHHRDAEAELKTALTRHPLHERGVLHCFTASTALALWAIEQGLFISFSGILTFKNADALRETAKAIPLESILLETDCPYLAPVPYRGKRNEPAFMVETAKCLATLKNISLEELSLITTRNTLELFNLSRRSYADG